MKFVVATSLILSLLSFPDARAIDLNGSFCGSIDFRNIGNENLENIIFLNNLENGWSKEPVQCGLRGESLAICSGCNDDLPEASMTILRPILGDKAHSDWHAKWHKVRSQSDSITAELFEKLRGSGLVPATIPRDEFFSMYQTGGRLSGENFFYMHRMMIKMVQFELSANGLPCVAPWTELPLTVDDDSWPAPRIYGSEEEKRADQETLERLREKLVKYFSPSLLQNISLNELGNLLESELHLNLHEFYRGSPPNSSEALSQGYEDDLLPVATSPLNRYFWKIHGLVDEILGNWLVANSYRGVALDCKQAAGCYQWEATWVGKYPNPQK